MKCCEAIQGNGFAIMATLFPPHWMNDVAEQLDRMSPARSRAGMRHAMRFEAIRGIAQHPALTQLACEVLGPRAFPFRATLFDKSPTANWLVVWHQDTALPLRAQIDVPGWGPWSTKEGIPYAQAPAEALSQVLALRVHLDDSTVDNGPLRVLPGTHTLGVLTDDRLHQLAEQIAPVACVVPKGGVMAMSPLLVHASSKSHAEVPRRVLHFEYAASDSIANPLQLEIA
jgi:ectoine hydroxylase-related dioxygenase (phytanoyl-CoA dioxygenase family)